MTAIADTAGKTQPNGWLRGLWFRQLDHYPSTGKRLLNLGIVVAATVVLYYELYVGGAVATEIITHYHMSFPYYVYISVVGNLIGAFSSIVAGLADRWGRANMVAYGLAITGLLTLFALPNAPDKWTFAILVAILSFVEGIILVATPALVRDFSPQLGRASAMGFWTLGPVVGSLMLAVISSNTIGFLPAWQTQFVICGVIGLVIFVVALFGLRELSPQLRDQLMVSLRDRQLVEARAKGLDVTESLKRPWRQMLHLDIVGSAFAVSVFLIIYYTAVGFFTVYFTTIFGYSLAEANGLGNWFWAFDAAALILVGIVSDRTKVRKPFMVVGAIGSVVMTIVFANLINYPQTSYATFVWVISLMAVCLAIAYAPWMASFTETVERRNPALTATGLAVWGWIVRMVVAISIGAMPFVVSSMTPLVEHGTEVQTLSTKYESQLATIKVIDPATLKALGSNPRDQAAIAKAVGEIAAAQKLDAAAAAGKLQAVAAVPKEGLAYLQTYGPQVVKAAAETRGQWQIWWWVCVGGEALFIPLIFVMAGRWSPRRAREDAEAHERLVQQELAALKQT